MYRSEITTGEEKKALYCIEEATKETIITNSSINFIVYSDTSLYKEVTDRIINTVKFGESKSLVQIYDDEMKINGEGIFTYKKTPLEEILNIVSDEAEIDDSEYLSSPKIFITSEFLTYEYRDRTRFISEVYGSFFKRLIKQRNVMFIIPFKVSKMPPSFKSETFDQDEFSDYNIALDLMEESSGTLAKFHFVFGYKQILDTVTV